MEVELELVAGIDSLDAQQTLMNDLNALCSASRQNVHRYGDGMRFVRDTRDIRVNVDEG